MADTFGDFAEITDTSGKLIVGSHPRNAEDIVFLHDSKGVRAIENLQENSEDLSYFTAIKEECKRKDIAYERVQVGFLHNGLQHFQITQMNHVKKLYYLKEIYSRVKNYQSSVV